MFATEGLQQRERFPEGRNKLERVAPIDKESQETKMMGIQKAKPPD
jgi:hypothetical protein